VHCHTDPVQAICAVLVEIANDDSLSTNSDGTKLCLSYAEMLLKQLSSPTVEDKAFTNWLYKALKDALKKRDRTVL